MESDATSSAHDSLAAVSEARSAAADRIITPWWYHPALGLISAAYLVAASLGSPVVLALAVGLLVGSLAVLTRAYRRLTGIWVWGTAAGRATRWAYAMGATMGAAMIASLIFLNTTSLIWPTYALAAAAGVAIVLMGRRFDDTLRRELRGEFEADA